MIRYLLLPKFASAVDIISINPYIGLPTSVSGLLKEEYTIVEGLQFVSPCEPVTKGNSKQSVAFSNWVPMFCALSSLIHRVNDANIFS